MPLTFDFTEIKEKEADDIGWIEVQDDPDGQTARVAPKSDAMIWHSLNTGIGTITEKNAAEVYARIALVETIYGPSLRMPSEDGKLEPYFLTEEDVARHIGLVTNASFRDETRASFLKRHAAYFLDKRVGDFNRQKAEVTA